jgi:hypothetical protein
MTEICCSEVSNLGALRASLSVDSSLLKSVATCVCTETVRVIDADWIRRSNMWPIIRTMAHWCQADGYIRHLISLSVFSYC